MISPQMPPEGLPLSNITGNCAIGISDANLRDIKVTGYTGALLRLRMCKTVDLKSPGDKLSHDFSPRHIG